MKWPVIHDGLCYNTSETLRSLFTPRRVPDVAAVSSASVSPALAATGEAAARLSWSPRVARATSSTSPPARGARRTPTHHPHPRRSSLGYRPLRVYPHGPRSWVSLPCRARRDASPPRSCSESFATRRAARRAPSPTRSPPGRNRRERGPNPNLRTLPRSLPRAGWSFRRRPGGLRRASRGSRPR